MYTLSKSMQFVLHKYKEEPLNPVSVEGNVITFEQEKIVRSKINQRIDINFMSGLYNKPFKTTDKDGKEIEKNLDRILLVDEDLHSTMYKNKVVEFGTKKSFNVESMSNVEYINEVIKEYYCFIADGLIYCNPGFELNLMLLNTNIETKKKQFGEESFRNISEQCNYLVGATFKNNSAADNEVKTMAFTTPSTENVLMFADSVNYRDVQSLSFVVRKRQVTVSNRGTITIKATKKDFIDQTHLLNIMEFLAGV